MAINLTLYSPVLRVTTTAVLLMIATAGCKRNTGTATGGGGTAGGTDGAGSTASGDGTPAGATATGTKSVTVLGNVVTYQNVHVQMPWDTSDPVDLVRRSQELVQDVAAGNGLPLKGGKWLLLIARDGRSMQLNGRDYGALKEGDSVVLSNDGKLTVNGIVRSAAQGPTTSP